MALIPIPELEKFKPILIQQAQELRQKKQPLLNQVLLSSSLLRWGVKPNFITIQNTLDLNQLVEDDEFSMFNANIANMLPYKVKKIGTSLKLSLFNYYCPAYNNVLFLENIILSQKSND
jgi:hypothetical protein